MSDTAAANPLPLLVTETTAALDKLKDTRPNLLYNVLPAQGGKYVIDTTVATHRQANPRYEGNGFRQESACLVIDPKSNTIVIAELDRTVGTYGTSGPGPIGPTEVRPLPQPARTLSDWQPTSAFGRLAKLVDIKQPSKQASDYTAESAVARLEELIKKNMYVPLAASYSPQNPSKEIFKIQPSRPKHRSDWQH